VLAVAVDGVPMAGISLKDSLAPHARACVTEMQMAGVEVWMCTGDNRAAACSVARECGVDAARIVAEACQGTRSASCRSYKHSQAQGVGETSSPWSVTA